MTDFDRQNIMIAGAALAASAILYFGGVAALVGTVIIGGIAVLALRAVTAS
jgi:hypothetical protein